MGRPYKNGLKRHESDKARQKKKQRRVTKIEDEEESKQKDGEKQNPNCWQWCQSLIL